MKTQRHLLWLAAALATVSFATAVRADVEGESALTPNQQRRIAKVNDDLPKDLLDQPRDSKKVADLRASLRQALSGYRQAVKQYGTGTAEAKAAAHHVADVQQSLHKQFVQEEAIPALSQLPQ